MNATLPATYKMNLELRFFVLINTVYQGILDRDYKFPKQSEKFIHLKSI
jgi:hypothetical protein